MPTFIASNIVWVGCADWHVRDFHSYDTHRGTTYNSYLIIDERPTVIDAVKAPFGREMLERIAAHIDPRTLAYVVCNHAEPDHAGALPELMAAAEQATLLCNAKCLSTLQRYFDTSRWRVKVVSSGEEIGLGKHTLRFIDTPMVHWPESMFTYVPEEQILFSMDAFGQHYASSTLFDDENDLSVVFTEAKAYYANIIMPYGKSVTTALDAAAALPLRVVAPSHGVIWRSHFARILDAYRGWSKHQAAPKVLIVFDTMWDSTSMMADALYAGANVEGVEVQLIHARRTSLTRLATEVLDAAALALGSATLNREMMPSMAAALSYIRGLRPQKKAGLAFGSYGWGRGSVEAIQQWLEEVCWDVLRPPLRSQYKPDRALLDECVRAGAQLAERALSVRR